MMIDRQLDIPPAALRPPGNISLQTPPHWTAIIFLTTLGLLHASIAVPAFLKYRWEGYLSAAFCVIFLTSAYTLYRAKCRVTFNAARRRIELCNGVWRFTFHRKISFDDVHAIRLTMSSSDRPRSRVEVLCDNEDIQCPPSDTSRQEALFLAILMNVELIKVWADKDADAHQTARLL